MRIALASHNFRRGDGQGRSLLELARWLTEVGHSVHLYANQWDADLQAKYGCQIHSVPAVDSPNLIKSLTFAAAAALLMSKRSYDVVHGNGTATLGRTDVNTCHFCHSAWRTLPADLRLTPGPGRTYHRTYTALHAYLERIAYGAAKRIIALSHMGFNELRLHVGLPQGSIHIVPYGVDGDEFHPASPEERVSLRKQLGLDPKRKYILFVGDLVTKRKGATSLLEAAKSLNGEKTTILFVGRTQSHFLPPPSQHGARITFLGYRHNVAELMRAADIFVLPTHYDTFGEVVLEALGTGLPSVVSSRAGSVDLIVDGTNGLILHEPRDASRLAELLHRLLNDTPLRVEIAAAARGTAVGRPWSSMAADVESIYHTL